MKNKLILIIIIIIIRIIIATVMMKVIMKIRVRYIIIIKKNSYDDTNNDNANI